MYLEGLEQYVQVRVSELSLTEAELLEVLHDRQSPSQRLTT